VRPEQSVQEMVDEVLQRQAKVCPDAPTGGKVTRYDDERLETFFAHFGEALTTGDLLTPRIPGGR
jgi:hypothetical protein